MQRKKFTITPTESSYYLNLVKEVGHGSANENSINSCFNSLSKILKTESSEIADKILKISAEKIRPVINQLIREYKLDRELVEFVGGGGGASAIVPFTAKHLGFSHRIAKDCEVISAIGAALGMIRDSIERTIINPTENDLINLRQQAFESVVRMGADPDTIEVSVEIDSRNKKVIAVAMGSTEMRLREVQSRQLSENEIKEIASKSFKTDKDKVTITDKTNFYYVVSFKRSKSILFGLIKENLNSIRVIDKEGTIKLQLNNATSKTVKVKEVKSVITKMISDMTTFGDAGALVPDIFILVSSKILDFTGLINENQIISLADYELKKVSQNEDVVVISSPKK